VVKARNAAYSAGQQAAQNPGERESMTALGGAEGQLAGALGRLFAVAEGLPGSEGQPRNMLALQEELSSTENKIAFRPAGVQRLRHVLQTPSAEVFPTTVIASMFNFQEAHLFEIEATHETRVKPPRFPLLDRPSVVRSGWPLF